MKYTLASIVIIVLIGCSNTDREITELEETVKRQALEIEQLKSAQTLQKEDDAIARELKVKRKACTKVTVTDDKASIYFCGMMAVAFFLENPEPQSRLDLQLFLQKTGLETGLIEYFTPQGEKIFSIVDRLTDEIKGDLTLPAAADEEQGIAIAEATTHSTEAYRYYLEGVDNLNKFYLQEAKASFDKALEHDSTFAMVYLRQANAGIAGGRAERKKAIAKAMQYADKVSKKEKHYDR